LRIIKKAKRRADKVRALLRELGDTDEHLALSVRYRHLSNTLGRTVPRGEVVNNFGKLSLAMQDLNLLLSEAFYPGP
jgi:hypothetical protein